MRGSMLRKAPSPPCPVRFGFCQCGLMQVGRPFHGDRVRILGPALPSGTRCAHDAFYERRPYNPIECGGAPELMECGPGDRICLLVNPSAYFDGRATAIWERGTIVTTSLDGALDSELGPRPSPGGLASSPAFSRALPFPPSYSYTGEYARPRL